MLQPRDITGAGSAGILLQEDQSRQSVSARALAKVIASAAPSTRVVVLNACYSTPVADSLRHDVDCVVGIDGAISYTAARSFAVAFYRALGHHRSIGNAVEQATAMLEAKHPGASARPMYAMRDGLHVDQIFLPKVLPAQFDHVRTGADTAERGNTAGTENWPRLLRTLSGHDRIIHRMEWSDDGRFLATTSRDMTARIWSLDELSPPVVLGENGRWVNAVAWDPTGTRLMIGLEDGRLRFWQRLKDGSWTSERDVAAHTMRVECVDWDPAGRYVASASADHTIAIWNAKSSGCIARIQDHQDWVNAVAWSPSGRWMATGGEDNTVRCWDGGSLVHMHTFRCAGLVRDIAWAPSEAWIAVSAGDSVSIWDLSGREEVRRISHDAKVRAVSFSADGQFLAAKSADGFVRVWRTSDWSGVATIPEPTVSEENPESTLRFHPSRSILATLGEGDLIVRLWHLEPDQDLSSSTARVDAVPVQDEQAKDEHS